MKLYPERACRVSPYLGLPALSAPDGLRNNRPPTGFQLVGPPFEEALLLSAARAFEKENPW